MSNKRKAVTPTGEVEYETVECTSCNQEVVKDDTELMVIGELYKPHRDIYGFYTGPRSHTEIHVKKGYTTGRICSGCKGDPAVRLPANTSFWRRLKYLVTGEI